MDFDKAVLGMPLDVKIKIQLPDLSVVYYPFKVNLISDIQCTDDKIIDTNQLETLTLQAPLVTTVLAPVPTVF